SSATPGEPASCGVHQGRRRLMARTAFETSIFFRDGASMLTRRRGIAGFFKQHAGAQIVLYDLDNFAAFARPKHKYRAGGVPPSRLAAREKEYAAASEFIISHREPREQPSPPSQHLGNATRIELVPDWHPGAPERY